MNRTQRLNHRLAFLCMLAPDNGGGTGGSGKTIEEKLTQAQADLGVEQGKVQSLTKERGDAIKERDDAKKEAGDLQKQFDAMEKAANDARAELATANDKVTSLTKERDDANGKIVTKDARIKNLEALCKVKGLNPDQAPQAVDEPQSAGSVADFDARIKAAKTPAEAAKITEEFEKAYSEGRVG